MGNRRTDECTGAGEAIESGRMFNPLEPGDTSLPGAAHKGIAPARQTETPAHQKAAFETQTAAHRAEYIANDLADG